MKSKCVAWLLLTLITVQFLPLKEMGSMLFNNVFTEELCTTASDLDSEQDSDLDKKSCFLHHHIAVVDLDPGMDAFRNKQSDTMLISRLTDDILTPPPLSA